MDEKITTPVEEIAEPQKTPAETPAEQTALLEKLDAVQQALAALRVDSTQELLNKSYGLSLSDQYWIKEKGSSLEWAEINFFENAFSRDIGDILFSGHSSSNKINVSG